MKVGDRVKCKDIDLEGVIASPCTLSNIKNPFFISTDCCWHVLWDNGDDWDEKEVNLIVIETTKQQINRGDREMTKGIGLAPPPPPPKWVVALDSETREPVVMGKRDPVFEGNSLYRKRSRDWWRLGRWGYYRADSYRQISAFDIRNSPFYIRAKEVIASTAEEAINEYKKQFIN